MRLKSIKEAKKIKGKRIFLRADFNVPMANGRIKDETKIIAALPTIRFLLRYNCKIILATHLGEPNGKKDKKLSTAPIAKRLENILGKKYAKIKFIEACTEKKAAEAAENLAAGEIIFLENLRFYKEEGANDKKFAKQLASLADIYVNEAFAVSHRRHASMNAIRKYLPSFAGLYLEKEINNLEKIKKPAKPMVILAGGAKISTKINLIKKLSGQAAQILLGGAMANSFFKAKKLEIGKSLIDKKSVLLAKSLLRDKKIVLPLDAIVAENGKKNHPRVKKINAIGKRDIILDIGPETIKKYSEIIRGAKTVIWNGPVGLFEERHFRHGTIALALIIASGARRKTFCVVGGGETLEALKISKTEHWMDWVSTGGGAMLAYLGGEEMPGLQ